MKKVNSIYIEFEPISGVVWSSLRYRIQKDLEEHVIRLLQWQTGCVEVSDIDEDQIDLFPNHGLRD